MPSPRALVAGANEIGRHLADKNGLIRLGEALNCFVESEFPYKTSAALVFAGVAYAPYNTKKIETDNRLLCVQLLRRTKEKIRVR
jgi:hypothetical protein